MHRTSKLTYEEIEAVIFDMLLFIVLGIRFELRFVERRIESEYDKIYTV